MVLLFLYGSAPDQVPGVEDAIGNFTASAKSRFFEKTPIVLLLN